MSGEEEEEEERVRGRMNSSCRKMKFVFLAIAFQAADMLFTCAAQNSFFFSFYLINEYCCQ